MSVLAIDAATAASSVTLAVCVFARVGGIMAFLPGFGERIVPMRVRLGVALAITALALPVVMPALLPLVPRTPTALMAAIAGEALAGLIIGFGLRVAVFALQTAGTIAAQSMTLTHLFGTPTSTEAEPPVATLLTMGGITLALLAGIHVDAVVAVVALYEALPFGLSAPSALAAPLMPAALHGPSSGEAVGALSHGSMSPGSLSPGSLSPGTLSPEALSPEALSPEALSPGALSPDPAVGSPSPRPPPTGMARQPAEYLAEDIVAWGVIGAERALGLGLSLAAPFVIVGFSYNLALGALSRAMPQLLVALVGAPLVIGLGLATLWYATPELYGRWLMAATPGWIEPIPGDAATLHARDGR
ncbi:MAG: flagellar biosynthetic protein FliR [Pseudomonadota bacterium]